MADQLFTLQYEEDYNFAAGSDHKNRQVIIGVLPNDLIALFFDAQGTLISVETRNVYPADRNPPPTVSERNEMDYAMWPLLDAWKAEIGFIPNAIAVKEFFLDGYPIGIRRLPDHFQRYVTKADRQTHVNVDLEDSIRKWVESGRYVFWWRKDYWVNAQGHITDS